MMTRQHLAPRSARPAPTRASLGTHALRAVGAAVLLALLAGCASTGGGGSADGRSALPANVYRQSSILPASLKRVAILPLHVIGQDPTLNDGRDALEPIVHAELLRCARFELVPVARENLRQWTGRTGWAYTDALPRDLFSRVTKETGCDAVMFCQLTHYKPYPPVAIGWRMHLVDPSGPTIVWAVDEIFEGSQDSVAGPARSYYKRHFATPTGAEPQSILASPRRFGQFTLSCVVDSLPAR